MTGYEKKDIRFSVIARAFGGLAVLLVVVGLCSWAALRIDSSHFSENASGRLPPEPRLQADPVADLRQRRAEEDAALSGCAWVDRSRGVIRVPIDRAMVLLLRRGLPTRGAVARLRS